MADLIERLRFYRRVWGDLPSIAPHSATAPGFTTGRVIRDAVEAADEIARLTAARALEDWHEDHGFVLWWTFPVCEPPYSGSPLCDDWPGYHTHWTSIPLPETPAPATGG